MSGKMGDKLVASKTFADAIGVEMKFYCPKCQEKIETPVKQTAVKKDRAFALAGKHEKCGTKFMWLSLGMEK